MKKFPILRGTMFDLKVHHPESIPWGLAERYRSQIEANGGYRLEVIADRGGVDIYHLYAAFTGRVLTEVRRMEEDEVIFYIEEMIEKFRCDMECIQKNISDNVNWG